MAQRFQDPQFSEYWSTLRFPSSGWVSEMLTEKLAQSAQGGAMTRRIEQKNMHTGRPRRAASTDDAFSIFMIPLR